MMKDKVNMMPFYKAINLLLQMKDMVETQELSLQLIQLFNISHILILVIQIL